jgi:hypothetical protein
VYLLETAIQAGNSLYELNLDPGAYLIALNVASQVTGTTTQFSVAHFVDEGHVAFGGSITFMPVDTGTATGSPTLPAGKAGRHWHMIANFPNTGVIVSYPVIQVPYGLRIQLLKGTAVQGEPCKVELVVTRTDKITAILPS